MGIKLWNKMKDLEYNGRIMKHISGGSNRGGVAWEKSRVSTDLGTRAHEIFNESLKLILTLRINEDSENELIQNFPLFY